MTVGFNDIPFEVLTQDGRMPLPVTDEENGIEFYEPQVRIRSQDLYRQLRALWSQVAIKPALGNARAGTVIVRRGVGAAVLIYPDGIEEIESDAILIGFEPETLLGRQDAYRVRLRFVVLEDPV